MEKPLKIIVSVFSIIVCFVSMFSTSVYAKPIETGDDIIVVQTKVEPVKTTNSKKKPIKIRYVKSIKANIRKKPSKKSLVLKVCYKGKKVKVREVKGNWCRIGKNKWICKKHLTKKDPMGTFQGVRLKYYNPYNITKNKLTRSRGVVYYKGHKETWYSIHEYGQSATAYHIPGKHLAKDGTFRDKDGYICVAASRKYGKGARLMTSLGPAKVYDRGVSGNTIDLYTNW